MSIVMVTHMQRMTGSVTGGCRLVGAACILAINLSPLSKVCEQHVTWRNFYWNYFINDQVYILWIFRFWALFCYLNSYFRLSTSNLAIFRFPKTWINPLVYVWIKLGHICTLIGKSFWLEIFVTFVHVRVAWRSQHKAQLCRDLTGI